VLLFLLTAGFAHPANTALHKHFLKTDPLLKWSNAKEVLCLFVILWI